MKNSIPRLASLALVIIALIPARARAANSAAADAPAILLIQNATILTVSHGTIEHGSILIKDGKIVDVGSSIKAPKEAQVIDAGGQFVIPGIIDCHSHIAVDGSVNEGSISVSSIVNIADVLPCIFYFHPWEIDPLPPRVKLPLAKSFAHYFRLGGFRERLERVLRGASFAPMGEVLGLAPLIA